MNRAFENAAERSHPSPARPSAQRRKVCTGTPELPPPSPDLDDGDDDPDGVPAKKSVGGATTTPDGVAPAVHPEKHDCLESSGHGACCECCGLAVSRLANFKGGETAHRCCASGTGEPCVTATILWDTLCDSIATEHKGKTPSQVRFQAYRKCGIPYGFCQENVSWYTSSVGARLDLPICVKVAILSTWPDSTSWSMDADRTGFKTKSAAV
jgi:hypothetical protein